MQARMRRVAAATVATVLLFSLIGCAATDEPDEAGSPSAEPYRIGAVLSLTGTYAGLGEPEQACMRGECEL